ncbi:LysR substrate-binding domain-containing protein [uncultured Sphingomonas sp.]|uniref:LysR substrate-binding domain-containing protein n=1 Tax=Sphingomonas sp. TaxID=28214 RepID=UPI002626B95B|nr:LysR substrate-binding domain-containing protein [uncultured Sphingomonas sp.]
MRRLPPLGAIEAFVQVARLGSIKAAAEELALSAPALSRRVQTLERFVGKPLFARRHQAMVPNDDGETLMAQIAPLLDQLSDAVEAMSSGQEVLRLRLGVLPLYASQKLFPRLGELRTAHPELHLDIDTAGHGIARLGEGLDAVIALGREIDPALYAKRLDTNRVYVIGAKTLLDGPDPIVRPEQMNGMTALLHREMPDAFTAWTSTVGLPNVKPKAIDFFDSGGLMLEAVAQGLGIAFMHASHFENAHDPRLVRLFDIEVESPYSHWFVCRPRALQQKPVKLFHDWLIRTLYPQAA